MITYPVEFLVGRTFKFDNRQYTSIRVSPHNSTKIWCQGPAPTFAPETPEMRRLPVADVVTALAHPFRGMVIQPSHTAILWHYETGNDFAGPGHRYKVQNREIIYQERAAEELPAGPFLFGNQYRATAEWMHEIEDGWVLHQGSALIGARNGPRPVFAWAPKNEIPIVWAASFQDRLAGRAETGPRIALALWCDAECREQTTGWKMSNAAVQAGCERVGKPLKAGN